MLTFDATLEIWKKKKKTFKAMISITCISIHSLGKVMIIKP
jgi:hypothetical protein